MTIALDFASERVQIKHWRSKGSRATDVSVLLQLQRDAAAQRVANDPIHRLALREKLIQRSFRLLVPLRIARVAPERDLREVIVPVPSARRALDVLRLRGRIVVDPGCSLILISFDEPRRQGGLLIPPLKGLKMASLLNP